MHVKITGNGSTHTVEVNGVDISKFIDALTLDIRANEIPRIGISLRPTTLEIDESMVKAYMSAHQEFDMKVRALNRLGDQK